MFLKDRNTNQNARCSGSAEYIFPLPEMREDQGLRESRVRGWGKWKEAEGDGAHLVMKERTLVLGRTEGWSRDLPSSRTPGPCLEADGGR